MNSAKLVNGTCAIREPRIQGYGQQRSEEEGYEDARMRGGHCGMHAVCEQADIEFQPDQEHIQDDAELRDQAQEGGDRGRQDPPGELRAEQRGPEQNAGDHLPDHGRLAQIGKELGQELPGDDNGRERHEDVQDDRGRLGGHFGERCDGSRRRGHQHLTIPANEEKGADGANDHDAVADR